MDRCRRCGRGEAVARRFVRCFELFEHGYFTEALIVAFAVLDDAVQLMLRSLLANRGLPSRRSQEDLLRGIKEHRLRLFLGPLLKMLAGRSLGEMWPESEVALAWLNTERNRAMHGGYKATRRAAALALFAAMKALVVLWRNGLADTEFPVEMFRHAKLTAAWEEDPPDWVPAGPKAETFEFE